jgi:D-beta-D-heptose 7-phosphate kinase/D-beta-D-heptose 1-phosphate adenosyltransferase
VILLKADAREDRLGGAGNVCHMLRGLEAEVTCAGVVGDDLEGATVRRLLEDTRVNSASVITDPTRPTTTKERFIGRAANRHPHQILRVDNEVNTPLDASLSAKLLGRLTSAMADHDIVLVSDYDKGVCTPELLQGVIAAARRLGVPVIVDPLRGATYDQYHGATTMTPNRLETELATGRKIETPEHAAAAGHELCQRLGLEHAIITLDRDGMTVVEPDGRWELFPTRARAVYDITGAGDMVLATIGVCYAAGASVADAVRLANVAAGLEVEKIGVAVVTLDEMRCELLAGRHGDGVKVVTLEQMEVLARSHRQQGRKVVFTNGCFDLLHVGHVTYLQEAADLGDVLIVAANSDESVRRLKGPSRPVIGENERARMLAALACVDHVLVFDEDTPMEMLRRIRPDVLVKGGTYAVDEVVGHEVVEAYGGEVRVTSVIGGVSTTKILDSLAEHGGPVLRSA